MNKLFTYTLNLLPRPLLIRASYIARPFVGLLLRGKKYTDPINGKSYRKFLPYGYARTRKNVLAPGTLSLERHRLLWLYLKHETDFFSGNHKLLHFAPEQAFYKRFKKLKNIHYTTTDLNSPLAHVKADICDLPFKNNTYDYIFCNHVLEHIPNHIKAMEELYRVLKPGGTAILQVPQDKLREVTFEDPTITDKEQRTKIFGQYDHVRVYGMDYFNTLRSVGFNVEAVDYTNTMTDSEIDRFRLAKGELLPVCKKLVVQ